jgi:glycosyltransferase involved in cell wall biosynthesis
MRIAHILPFNEIGGTEIGQLNVMRAGRKAGVDSFAIFPPDSEKVVTHFRDAGFEAFSYEPPPPSFRRGVAFYQASSRAAALLRQHGAKAVHCANVLGGYHWSLAGRLAAIPVLCHVRGRFDQMPFREGFFLRWVNRWVFVSQSAWDRFSIAVRPADGSVLYDGVSFASAPEDAAESVRAEFGLAPDTVLAAMFCRVAPQKDFETLIRAAAILSSRVPRLRFLIVGDNGNVEASRAHYAQVQQWLGEHDVSGRFLFTGFRRDVARLIRACDISVLSTHGEGLPLVLLEAMSHARPVVATGIDGIPELVTDGETGLLTPHGDAAALAAALERLAADPALAARLGQAGRRMVETKFSQEEFERQVERLYRGLLGQG